MTFTTSVTLDKALFVTIIESMREQHYHDKKCSEMISEMFGAECFGLYDNSKYLVSLMALLRLHFPVDADGFCEIEHYAYVLNFGKLGESYESPGELYDRLNKN
jgi:hypothetical protein